jgi:hypothetical protein
MSYQIADEPAANEGRGNFIFRPSAPLLAAMLCGSWLAFPWFAVNALALGGPTARREVRLAVLAVGGKILFAFAIYSLVDAGVIESRLALRLALLALTSFKIGFAYVLSTIQARTFNVYEYYGGTVQKTMYVIVAGRYLTPLIFGISASPIWHAIVS